MRIFVNYTFKGRRSSIELPEKLVTLFHQKYPNKNIGRFISSFLKEEKGTRNGSSFVLSKLIEILL